MICNGGDEVHQDKIYKEQDKKGHDADREDERKNDKSVASTYKGVKSCTPSPTCIAERTIER